MAALRITWIRTEHLLGRCRHYLPAVLGMPSLPLTDPESSPATDPLLEGLVEIHTRNLHEPLPDGGLNPYNRAPATAVKQVIRRAKGSGTLLPSQAEETSA